MLMTEQLYKENGEYYILRRCFTGKLSNTLSDELAILSRNDLAKEKKNLKAYLNGESRYRHGYHTNKDNLRVPTWFDTDVSTKRIPISKAEVEAIFAKHPDTKIKDTTPNEETKELATV